MGCPGEEELTLIAEALDRAAAGEGVEPNDTLHQHLQDCRACAEAVEAERLVLAQLRALPDYGLATALPPEAYFADLGDRITAAALVAGTMGGERPATPEDDAPRPVVISLAERRWGLAARTATGLALAAAACLAFLLALPEPTTTSPSPSALAEAEAEELEAFEALFGDSFLLGNTLLEESDDQLEDTLLAVAGEGEGERVGDALPLLEGIAPSGLTDEELSELLDDWENRG